MVTFAQVTSGFTSAALSQVERVVVESEVTPTYSYNPNAPSAPPSEPGASGAWGHVAKPAVTVYGRGGTLLARYAPYGDPVPERFLPLVYVAAGVGVLATGYVLYRAFVQKPARQANPPRRRKKSRAAAWRSARRKRLARAA